MSLKMFFLLKTLLFLLCIYIKRVTAMTLADTDLRPPLGEILNFADLTTFDGETMVTIDCPIEQSILIKREYADQVNSTELVELRNKTIETVITSWTKDEGPVHRSNGNPIFDPRNGGSRDLTLLRVTYSDNGFYICNFNYSNVPEEASSYYDLYPGARIQLKVEHRDTLPDTKPIVSHEPKDVIVRRGDDTEFTCKSEATHLAQYRYWFKSCEIPPPSEAEPKCINNFMRAFKKAERQLNPDRAKEYMWRYLIMDERGEELHIRNVSDKDAAHYGCLVFNQKGFDIRSARLSLFERYFSEFGAGTTQASQTIKTTVTTQSDNVLLLVNNPYPQIPNNSLGVAASEVRTENLVIEKVAVAAGIIAIFGCILFFAFYYIKRSVMSNNEQKLKQNNIDPLVGSNSNDSRQHLPNIKSPNMYNISKNDGFISGHLQQGNGHLMTQAICGDRLDKEKNPSISSNTNSDEASSWGKSLSSHSDNSTMRALYLHTSNTTATTVPMYDHPPSSGLVCSPIVRNACVSNPLYGYLQPDFDAVWAFPRRNLERLNKIGEGQFGEVWRYVARQKDGSEGIVAVKQLKNRVGLGNRERLELIAEIEIMKSLSNHPNVIKLLYYCADDYQPTLLIMEYAENGKLQTYLRDCRSVKKFNIYCISEPSPTITSKELIKFSYHIAKGMEYVASQGIIHRDLASRNILVSKDKVCKVADFGFARRISDDCAYERTTTNPVPVKWMAPEALVENKFTSKSDVFSFGILMWEIVTLGATPYEYLTSTEVYKKVTEGGRLERPAHCKDEFYSIMASCWLQDPTLRPSFKELAIQLEQLLLSENDYIELDQYPEHAYYNILNTAEKEVVHITPPP